MTTRHPGLGLQASSSAPHLATCANGVMQRSYSNSGNALTTSPGFSMLLDVRRPGDGPGGLCGIPSAQPDHAPTRGQPLDGIGGCLGSVRSTAPLCVKWILVWGW